MFSIEEYYQKINDSLVYQVAEETPLSFCPVLSTKTKNNVFLKREDLQSVFSFKLRGAFNKIAHLSDQQRQQGLLACSAGNHAQGVALSGQHFKCPTTIVMPVSAPVIKINPVKKLGANVILHGDTYQEAFDYALSYTKKNNLIFVHPFDDPDVIAGQGTVAKEIDQQIESPEYIFIPIGGGGLASGICAYFKHVHPEVKLIGVEPVEAPSMYESIQVNQIVKLDWVGSFADGVAVKQVGQETFRICSQYLDDIVLVSTDQICSAIKDSFEDVRVLLEASGALAVAGLKKYVSEKNLQSKNLVAIASGANVNFDRLRHVAERAQIGENREVIIAVKLEEQPGSLKHFCKTIGDHSITEFNYRYNQGSDAHVFVGIGIEDPSDRDRLFQDLEAAQINFYDLSKSEVAKIHVRHMIGGCPPGNHGEKVFRFEFPERAGALKDFLSIIPSDWNISLFHYRCHGSDRGRVFVGLQIPDSFDGDVQQVLELTGYSFWEETDNLAYNIFCVADA